MKYILVVLFLVGGEWVPGGEGWHPMPMPSYEECVKTQEKETKRHLERIA